MYARTGASPSALPAVPARPPTRFAGALVEGFARFAAFWEAFFAAVFLGMAFFVPRVAAFFVARFALCFTAFFAAIGRGAPLRCMVVTVPPGRSRAALSHQPSSSSRRAPHARPMNARVDVREDHLLIELQGIDQVAALRRTLVVPFSTIEGVACEAPEWPKLGSVRVGTHVPGRIAAGAFRQDGGRQFIDIGRDTRQALRLTLRGHPEFDAVEIATDEPERIVGEVARHRPESVQRPPVYE
jgi:hypothetical protein